MKLTPDQIALLAEWRATLPPLAPEEIRVKLHGRFPTWLLVLKGSQGTVFRSEPDSDPDRRVLYVWAESARGWDDGKRIHNEERRALMIDVSRLLSPDLQVIANDPSPWNGRKNTLERYVLELILSRELLEHPFKPEGLRFVEAGDVVGEASYEGELNAVFRVSGFSLRTNGTWTDHLWEDVEAPLPPFDAAGPNRTLLQIDLVDGQVVSFEMDHFGGYYSLFSQVVRWLRTGSEADWWKRFEARKWLPKQQPPPDGDGA